MSLSFEVGQGISEDIEIVFNIGSGTSNPRFKYDATASKIKYAHDGTTWETLGSGPSNGATWDDPWYFGSFRVWGDETNEVMRWKFGSDPTSEEDGYEFGQFTDFDRV